MNDFDIAPEPDAEGLTANLQGLDGQGQPVSLPVVQERPLDHLFKSSGNCYRNDTGGQAAGNGCRLFI